MKEAIELYLDAWRVVPKFREILRLKLQKLSRAELLARATFQEKSMRLHGLLFRADQYKAVIDKLS